MANQNWDPNECSARPGDPNCFCRKKTIDGYIVEKTLIPKDFFMPGNPPEDRYVCSYPGTHKCNVGGPGSKDCVCTPLKENHGKQSFTNTYHKCHCDPPSQKFLLLRGSIRPGDNPYPAQDTFLCCGGSIYDDRLCKPGGWKPNIITTTPITTPIPAKPLVKPVITTLQPTVVKKDTVIIPPLEKDKKTNAAVVQVKKEDPNGKIRIKVGGDKVIGDDKIVTLSKSSEEKVGGVVNIIKKDIKRVVKGGVAVFRRTVPKPSAKTKQEVLGLINKKLGDRKGNFQKTIYTEGLIEKIQGNPLFTSGSQIDIAKIRTIGLGEYLAEKNQSIKEFHDILTGTSTGNDIRKVETFVSFVMVEHFSQGEITMDELIKVVENERAAAIGETVDLESSDENALIDTVAADVTGEPIAPIAQAPVAGNVQAPVAGAPGYAPSGQGMSKTTIIIIVVSVILALLFLGMLIFFLTKKKPQVTNPFSFF